MPRHRALLVIISLLLGSTACALQDSSGEAPPQAITPSPEALEVTPVSLDLCTLLTATEVSDALGEAVEVQPGLQTGACSFATTTSTQPKSVAVSAAQGSQARDLVQMSASLGLLFGGNADSQRIAEDLQANAASMSLQEVVEKADTLLVPLGYAYSAAGTQDMPAIWGWNPMGAGSLQQVDGETYLAVSVVGLDETAAKSLTTSLLALAGERLPAAFTIELAESLRVEFTAQAPTLAPEPTPTLVPPALAPEPTPTLVR
jgi:hypothetical protein